MKVFLSICAILLVTNVNGQKAPVRFVPIDSISIVRPGQKVKLDFRTDSQDIIPYPSWYPSLRGAKRIPGDIHWYGDTVTLTIDSEEIQFVERKGKTVDYYLFGLEGLESRNYKPGYVMVIPYSIIQDNNDNSVLFRLTIELYKQKRNKKWKEINSRTTDIWIDKKDLDGVLISEIGY